MIHLFNCTPFVISFSGRNVVKQKKIYLNMNTLLGRRGVYIGKIKEMFINDLSSQLSRVKIKCPIIIEYTLIKGTLKKKDRNNILSIVDKFFCDALIHYKCIADDNDSVILSTTFNSQYKKNKFDKVIVKITEI